MTIKVCDCDECGAGLCFGAVLCDECGVACDPDKTRGFTTERTMTRGDTIEIEYTLTDPDTGAPVDLGAAGVKVWFTVNPTIPKLATDPVLFQGTLVSGAITIVGLGTSGMILVTIPATTTQFLTDGIEKLYYDLQLKDGAGRVRTVEKGLFRVWPDITRAAT